MNKYTVEYTTENPAREAGRATWYGFAVVLAVILLAGVL